MGIVSRILMVFKAKASSALDRAEDPRQLVQYMHRMKKEMGDVSPEFDQMVDELESEAQHPEGESAGEEPYDEEL